MKTRTYTVNFSGTLTISVPLMGNEADETEERTLDYARECAEMALGGLQSEVESCTYYSDEPELTT
jgi:hypothetical protein